MTLSQQTLGLWESSTCCPKSAQRAQDQAMQSLGCTILVHSILKTNFPEIQVVAKADLSQ